MLLSYGKLQRATQHQNIKYDINVCICVESKNNFQQKKKYTYNLTS